MLNGTPRQTAIDKALAEKLASSERCIVLVQKQATRGATWSIVNTTSDGFVDGVAKAEELARAATDAPDVIQAIVLRTVAYKTVPGPASTAAAVKPG